MHTHILISYACIWKNIIMKRDKNTGIAKVVTTGEPATSRRDETGRDENRERDILAVSGKGHEWEADRPTVENKEWKWTMQLNNLSNELMQYT